jgi:hypothetical protein
VGGGAEINKNNVNFVGIGAKRTTKRPDEDMNRRQNRQINNLEIALVLIKGYFLLRQCGVKPMRSTCRASKWGFCFKTKPINKAHRLCL